MPIIRKVMDLRTARAICLPKSWLEFYEKENGCNITEVAIEVNSILKVSPILPKKEDRKARERVSHDQG
jgi:hypothetical protein